MANKKASDLGATGTPTTTMVFPVLKSGATEMTKSTQTSLSVASGTDMVEQKTAVNVWVTPKAFYEAEASTGDKGVIMIAQTADVIESTDIDKALTPSNMGAIATALTDGITDVISGDIDATSQFAVAITDWKVMEIGSLIVHNANIVITSEGTNANAKIVVLNQSALMKKVAVNGTLVGGGVNQTVTGYAVTVAGKLEIELSELTYGWDTGQAYTVTLSFTAFKAYVIYPS